MTTGRDQGSSGKLGIRTINTVFIAESTCSACCHGEREPRRNSLLSLGDPVKGPSPLECVIGQAQIKGSQPSCTRSQGGGDKASSLLPAAMGNGKNTSTCKGGEAISQEETKV